MTEKLIKVADIISGSEGVKCPVTRSLSVWKEFLRGPMCGRCYPCAFGSYEAVLRLKELTSGTGSQNDLEALSFIALKMKSLSMCKKGKDMADFLLDVLNENAFEEHLRGICAAKECKPLIEYRNISENCIRCGKCMEACKFDAIIGEKQVSYKCCHMPFEIRQLRCTKCGECIKVCPTGAIVIVNLAEEAEVMV